MRGAHDAEILASDREDLAAMEECLKSVARVRKNLARSIRLLKAAKEACSFRERAARQMRDASQALTAGAKQLKQQVAMRLNRRAFVRKASAALTRAGDFTPTDPSSLVRLQNAIVDSRYAETGWRTIQNYVGQTRSDFSEQVHYVSPRPDDVPELMNAWMKALEFFRAKL